MDKLVLSVVMVILVVALPSLASTSTVPAFLWSSNSPNPRVEASVNYQTVSPKDVANSLVSTFMSSQQSRLDLDLALVFVGTNQLQASNFYANGNGDKDLFNLLKVSYTSSNFSMAFPYVATSETETLPNSLLQGLSAGDAGFNNVAISESCSLPYGNSQRLPNLQSVNDYLASRTEKREKGEADVVVFCHEGSNSLDELHQSHSEEGETFAKLVSTMDQSGEKYAVLYVSDPSKIKYPSNREVERFLAESTNATGCGEVCKIKSSLLEGLLVAIVLLIILISGICCMMGIDTPTRFEAPQES